MKTNLQQNGGKPCSVSWKAKILGVTDGTRTRNNKLHKLGLYH